MRCAKPLKATQGANFSVGSLSLSSLPGPAEMELPNSQPSWDPQAGWLWRRTGANARCCCKDRASDRPACAAKSKVDLNRACSPPSIRVLKLADDPRLDPPGNDFWNAHRPTEARSPRSSLFQRADRASATIIERAKANPPFFRNTRPLFLRLATATAPKSDSAQTGASLMIEPGNKNSSSVPTMGCANLSHWVALLMWIGQNTCGKQGSRKHKSIPSRKHGILCAW
ncbi:uncharacterized protein B0H64DRAFT_382281 [Chaetomium fimeti]|uniref:Uncharacterized protein n=1 Tax=Chaetomium fimeti TaxID=1854472 RepID=A0AAE0HQN9_9PEZI|nr:hypothetical protein B0H64DRAFT_382281 [Chaetomium fimeti]